MSLDQLDHFGPTTTRHILILFLKDIQLHEGYWLAASQASIQSLYTSTGSDRSEEQCIKDKKNVVEFISVGRPSSSIGRTHISCTEAFCCVSPPRHSSCFLSSLYTVPSIKLWKAQKILKIRVYIPADHGDINIGNQYRRENKMWTTARKEWL